MDFFSLQVGSPAPTLKNGIPIPFATESNLQGAITLVDRRNGIDVYNVTFHDGEESVLLQQNKIYVVHIPNHESIVNAPLDHVMKEMTTQGHTVNFYGYRYSDAAATMERRDISALRFKDRFPGQFFASAKARAEDKNHGNSLDAFEKANNIVFLPTDESPTSVRLDKAGSLYVFVVNEKDGALLSPRDHGVCGNGVPEGTEECDDGNQNDADLCTNACTRGIPVPFETVSTSVGSSSDASSESSSSSDASSSTSSSSSAPSECGNGVIEDGEACDAGVATIEGCTDACTVREGYFCYGEPSTCQQEPPSIAHWFDTADILGTIADPPVAGERYDHMEHPSVVALDEHRAIAVWSHGLFHSSMGAASRREILASVFDGTSWGEPQVVDPMTDVEPLYCRNCTDPVVVADHQGKVHIFWEGVTPPSGSVPNRQFDYARFVVTFDGTNFTEKKTLSMSPYFFAGELSTTFNEAGEGVASWAELPMNLDEPSTYYASRYSPDTGWSTPEIVASFHQHDGLILNGGDHLFFRPAVGIDQQGKITVLYRDVLPLGKRADGVTVYRADLFSKTFDGTSWSDPETVVSETETWEGPSPSYPGMTYTHSVNAFTYQMRPDGSALLAYMLTVPSTEPGSQNMPVQSMYTKEWTQGAWSASLKLPQYDYSAKTMAPLIAIDPVSSDTALVAWRQGSSYALSALKDGMWYQLSASDIGADGLPLFVHWSSARGRYLIGMAQTRDPAEQYAKRHRGIALLEYVPESGALTSSSALDIVDSEAVLSADLAELTDHDALVWLQPIKKQFLDDPRFSVYQNILKQAVFTK